MSWSSKRPPSLWLSNKQPICTWKLWFMRKKNLMNSRHLFVKAFTVYTEIQKQVARQTLFLGWNENIFSAYDACLTHAQWLCKPNPNRDKTGVNKITLCGDSILATRQTQLNIPGSGDPKTEAIAKTDELKKRRNYEWCSLNRLVVKIRHRTY
jgi:hypothetical protein